MAPRPRLPLVGAPFLLLVAVVFAQLGSMSTCAGEARRLHGFVACLDCDAGHDLSGSSAPRSGSARRRGLRSRASCRGGRLLAPLPTRLAPASPSSRGGGDRWRHGSDNDGRPVTRGVQAPRVPSPRPRTPVRSPPPAGGSGSPYGMGGLPLIYFFPFIPIIGIP
ncbi:hypothetical protein EJB05_21448 [Eragrostis curvula]|uniref:Uncharacterized protein n=1 Tax=Eragrostis curvula TaxID=38414 RepID=A0A5J9V3D7_9POAL|nr:hypothetical protein EJB05_21448 [Eragrostis curvula]